MRVDEAVVISGTIYELIQDFSRYWKQLRRVIGIWQEQVHVGVVYGVEYFAPSRWYAHLCRLKLFKKLRGPSTVSLPPRRLHIIVLHHGPRVATPAGMGGGRCEASGRGAAFELGGPSDVKEEEPVKKP